MLPTTAVDRLERLDRATAALSSPVAIVDLAAFDANADAMTANAAGKPLRVASKSVRCRDALRRVLARPGWHGVLAYTLPEALWLVRDGVTDDAVVGYPTADRAAIARLAADPAAARAMAARGRTRVQTRFAAGPCLAQLGAVIDDALTGRKERACRPVGRS